MNLVLDTNILYTFFWKGSLIKKLLLADYDLYIPEFAIDELNKHETEILQKTKLTKAEFKEFKDRLCEAVEVVAFQEYSELFLKLLTYSLNMPKI